MANANVRSHLSEADVWQAVDGLDSVMLVRCLVWTIRLSSKPGRDSNSMVHSLDDMVVEKG
jgi:hypothetical protein